jgi:type IV pilus assembly protein PilE
MAKASTFTMGHGLRRLAGFTLLEVLIVVAIIGFLMLITLPSYQESMRKGRRADAKALLMTAANREESHMLDRNTYTDDMTELGFAKDPMTSAEGHYTVAAAACAGSTIDKCYVLTATPVAGGAQAKDARCTELTIDSTGKKDAKGTAKDECW